VGKFLRLELGEYYSYKSQSKEHSNCSAPNVFQWLTLFGLVAGAGVITVGTGISVTAIATTIVTMLIAGTSIEAISAAIGSHIAIVTGTIPVIGALIAQIASILSC
jgi:hypothetical protein